MDAYEMLMGKPRSVESENRANQLALTLYRGELSVIDDKLHRDQCKKHFKHTEQTLNKRKVELKGLIKELEGKL